ncbi:hypothetical protein ABT124_50570 [Streptomyces sp. NPDC001982]|uniref:hypothetical protein n=1 Tax=Streptomyces sp. NPDC001982 TaxID=3154405 RepID=UPI00332E5083
MRLTLESLDDLKGAARLASWLGRPSVDEVVVRTPWLAAEEQDRSAKAIRRLFNDCGCAVGMAAFAIATAAVLVLQLPRHGWSWAPVGTALLVGVGAAVVGKLLGLAWSCLRLRALLRRMSGA